MKLMSEPTNIKLVSDKPVVPETALQKRMNSVLEIMKRKNYNPIEAMIDLAQNPTTPVEVEAQMHKELAKYYAPQLKSVDTTTRGPSGFVVNIMRFSQQRAEQLDLPKPEKQYAMVDNVETPPLIPGTLTVDVEQIKVEQTPIYDEDPDE